MLLGHPRRIGFTHHSGPDVFELVGGHAHADSRSTDEHTGIGPSVRNTFGDLLVIIRIIDRISGLATQVFDTMGFFLQKVDEEFLELKTAVIGSNGDIHNGNNSRDSLAGFFNRNDFDILVESARGANTMGHLGGGTTGALLHLWPQ